MPGPLRRSLTALRLLRERRWEDLRRAMRHRALPKWLWFRTELLIVLLGDLKTVPLDLSHVHVRPAHEADIPLLQQIRAREDAYRPAFARGDLCTLALVGERPAAMAWFDPRDVHASPVNGYELVVGPEGCYSYGIEVHPDFRLVGAIFKLWEESVRWLDEQGLRSVYAAIPTDNPLSIRSHTRLGFVPLARFSTTRCLGTRRHRLEPEEGERRSGWGPLKFGPLDPRSGKENGN